MQSDGEVVEPMATQLAGAEQSAIEQKKRIHPALAFGLGMLSFAGWFGGLLLDGKVFYHNALGSFLAHLPLMLVPAALVLLIGLRQLPASVRMLRRTVFAWVLVIVLTAPDLIPELSHHPLWLPLRLPIYGLGLALALTDSGMRIGLDRHASRRFSPATMAGAGFGVCAIVTAFVALSLPQPQPTCHGLSCGALIGLAEMVFCGGSLWTALIAVIGAALGYRIGEVTRTRWRTASSER